MDLREHLADSVNEVPSTSADRCVHARVEVASCTECVTACPHEAWVLDEDALAIDTDLCDGCGLCVAHCPEGALAQPDRTQLSSLTRRELEIACHRRTESSDSDHVRCINAISLRQIASLYGRGLRRLTLCIEDCATCAYRDENGLIAQTHAFNQVLRQRGLPPIAVISAPGNTQRPLDRRLSESKDGPRLSRRGFFRHLARAVADRDPAAAKAAVAAPGTSLPEARIGDLALRVPHIDDHRCNGCDACTRVCQHAALSLASDDAAYLVNADRCTGCGLCVDVCDQGAVRVAELATVNQLKVPLRNGVCRACGARFHRPASTDEPGTLCQICSQINHGKNLFQVLP